MVSEHILHPEKGLKITREKKSIHATTPRILSEKVYITNLIQSFI